MEPRDPAQSWRDVVHRHWEVAVASAILVGVLTTIDAAFVDDRAAVLSIAPFVFVLFAAVMRMTMGFVVAWTGAFVLLAVVTGRASFAGLAYPALVMMVLVAIQQRRERHE